MESKLLYIKLSSLMIVFLVVIFSNYFQFTQQLGTENWINCEYYCKQHGNRIPDWYRSFNGLNRDNCICMEQESQDEIIDENKLSSVRDNPLICSNAGASCESCCKEHLGLTDWDKSFTDFRPNLCVCKVNPDEIFTPSMEPEVKDRQTSRANLEQEENKATGDNNKYIDKFSQPQTCRKAGPSCGFCCRKESKVIDWNRSFKGNNKCICKDKPVS